MYIFTKLFLLTQLALTLVHGQTSTENSTHDDSDDDNIITEEGDNYTFFIRGGYRPTQHYANFIVSMRGGRPKKFVGDNHMCGGSIIAKDVVLTAAHCVVNKNGKKLTPFINLVAGNPFLFQNSPTMRTHKVERYVVHPKYKSKTIKNDIALLFLGKNFPLNNISLSPIAIADKAPHSNMECFAAGWGRVYVDGPRPDELLYVNVTLQPKSECKKMFKEMRPSLVCAGDRDDPHKGVWEGDSGGPLVCDGKLVGISSFGYVIGGYNFYTNVHHYRKWILAGSAGNLSLNGYGKLILTVFIVKFLFV